MNFDMEFTKHSSGIIQLESETKIKQDQIVDVSNYIQRDHNKIWGLLSRNLHIVKNNQ